jgi:hypothetical protein
MVAVFTHHCITSKHYSSCIASRFANKLLTIDVFGKKKYFVIACITSLLFCKNLQVFGAVGSMSDRICIASEGKVNAHISAEDLLSCCEDCGDG